MTMDSFHSMLRDAAGQRPAGDASNGSAQMPTHNMLMSQGFSMPADTSNGMGLPMGMQPMSAASSAMPGMTAPNNMMMQGNLQSFAGLATSNGVPLPPTMAANNAQVAPSAASNGAERGKSKKRKSSAAENNSNKKAAGNNNSNSEQEEKQPEEYTDPKAKRRAQIAKAARKHRQRQKDELIALRSKVKDLKEQIEVLQSSEPSEHNTELGWKQEAEQHAEIRARVDKENEFLRKTLMEQMKFIQRLQDYFTKQPLLNMPSLDMILNSSSGAASTPGALSSSIASAANPSTLQLSAGSFQDSLTQQATDGMRALDAQVAACEAAFQNPRNQTMTYFGLQVQYELGQEETSIYFRHHLYSLDAKQVLDDLWSCLGNAEFEGQFPFSESVELLEDLDDKTKYVHRIWNLGASTDASHSGSKLRTEDLCIHKRREDADGSVYCLGKSVMDDPSRPKNPNIVRRNTTSALQLRPFTDSTGYGCVMLWSVKVALEGSAEERAKPHNLPDMVLKNLFEVYPVFVKAVADRARGSGSQGTEEQS